MLFLRAIAIAAILARLPGLTRLPIRRVGLIGVLRILWWMLLAFPGMMLFATRPLWPLLRRAAIAGAIRRHATLSLATTWRGMLRALRLAGRCGWHIATSFAGALLLVDPDGESTPRRLFRLGGGGFRSWCWHHSSGLLSGFWLLAARVTHPWQTSTPFRLRFVIASSEHHGRSGWWSNLRLTRRSGQGGTRAPTTTLRRGDTIHVA